MVPNSLLLAFTFAFLSTVESLATPVFSDISVNISSAPLPWANTSQYLFSTTDMNKTVSQAASDAPDVPLLLLPPVPIASPSSAVVTSAVISTSTEMITDTVTLTEPPLTVTVSASPSTVTDVVTVIVSPTVTSPTDSSSWAAPTTMTDLAAFNVSSFPVGQHNLDIVNGIPATASSTTGLLDALSTALPGSPAPASTWDNSSSVLQLLYPAQSINPGNKPQGGAEFYASPLEMTAARSITLEYSVFFPADFDWVLAGKLPGLYGGHGGCSGGDAALDCFSTRLMWRKGGLGELYLYAPKSKQTDALCSDPTSVCDAAYGFSVGRGSFKWKSGAWTNVRQTVKLNTPGEQDGSFSLDVDGQRVIDRQDVYYRGLPTNQAENSPTTVRTTATTTKAPKATSKALTSVPLPASTTSADGGLLGSLLGGILRRDSLSEDYPDGEVPASYRPPLLPLDDPSDSDDSDDGAATTDAAAAALISQDAALTWTYGPILLTMLPDVTPAAAAETGVFFDSESSAGASGPTAATATAMMTPLVTTVVTKLAYPTNLALAGEFKQQLDKPVGFIGLFFSTFFGGHEQQYATPRDQYTWFKDFSITFNS